MEYTLYLRNLCLRYQSSIILHLNDNRSTKTMISSVSLTGFALGTSTASTQSGGFKIGATTLPPAFPGTTSTAPGTTATVAPAMGFAMPIPSSTATVGGGLGMGMGLGGAVKPTLTSTTSTLGGLFNTQTPAAKPAGKIAVGRVHLNLITD